MSFWGELKRRNVVKVAAAYAIVAWLVVQIASILLPAFEAPDWVLRVIVLLLAVGFVISLFVAWAYELTPEGLKQTSEVPVADSVAHVTGQRLNYVVTTLLAVAVVFLALDRFVIGGATELSPDTAPAATAGASAETLMPASVAVLPFENLSADPDQDYFSDGISVELRDQIYSAKDLYVTPRELVLPLKGSSDPPAAIAEALGVAHLLTGNIRKAGDTVRIAATLIQVTDGTRIWNETYEGSLEQVLNFQSAIAAAVIEELTGSFDANAIDSYAGGTDNEIAYDLYLKGQASADLQEQIALYSEALTLDPDFALAQTALASLRLLSAETIGAGAPQEVIDAAERAVQRAVEIGPELIGTQLLVARRNIAVGQWFEAEQVYLAALEQTGDRDFTVNQAYGSFLVRVGRLEDAIPYFQRARSLAPLAAGPGVWLAVIYDSLGEPDRSEEFEQIAEPLFTGVPFTKYGPALWRAMYRRDYDRARRAMELGNIYFAEARDIADADAMLAWARETFEDPEQQVAVAQQFVALTAATYDDTELAVAAWRKTLQSSSAYMFIFWTPLMTSVRTHPDFKDALREAGFVDYWREAGWPDLCSPVGDDDFECR